MSDGEATGTWHHGLVARWWAEFNTGGPEIAYFRSLVAAHGEPALDAGCGTGRLLLPLLRDGVDVDGVDVAPDMLARCRERARREGLAPRLFEQPLHALALPRRYRTIFVCGSFGIGGEPARDREAAARLRGHLAPGGVLAIDLPGAVEGARWRAWAERERARLPQPWPATGERRTAADGDVLELRTRVADADPAARVITLEIRVGLHRGGRLVAEEQGSLREVVYDEPQLIAQLREAGFTNVRGVDGYAAEGAIGGGNADGVVRVVLASD